MNPKKVNRVIFQIVIIIILLTLTNACEKGHIHGTGKMTTETRIVESFHSVQISDNITTHFHFSKENTFRIEIQGGEKLLPKIFTTVTDSILYISNGNKWNWLRNYDKSDIIINIYTDSVKYIKYDGYKRIEFHDTLYISTFRFESMGGMGSIQLNVKSDSASVIIHKGSPDILIKGTSQDFYLYTHAHGKLNALDFNCQNLIVHSAGTAHCYVSPQNSIGATIDYLGNVYYKNNPSIIWLIENNEGKLIKIN
jgi:hypothetical protein